MYILRKAHTKDMFTSYIIFLFYVLALVNCGDPDVLSNGRRHGSRYWTGESVSFVCDPEYHLTGPATRMCLPSGNWSGVQPSCKFIVANLNKPLAYLRFLFHFQKKINSACLAQQWIRSVFYEKYVLLLELPGRSIINRELPMQEAVSLFLLFKVEEFAKLWKARNTVLFTGSNFGKENMSHLVAGLVTGSMDLQNFIV